jgi:uncharacterized OB-fold protein
MPTDGTGLDLAYDESSAPFFEAAARGELLLQYCLSCDSWMWPIRYRCINCFAPDVEWRTASGAATLYSLSVVHQRYPGFPSTYVIATVETDEGVRFNTSLVGEDAQSMAIGSCLMAVFDSDEKPFPIPRFRRIP